MVWLLALEVADALVEPVDLVLGALADGALGLAVVGALPGQLVGREVRDAARVGRRAPLLGRLPVGIAVVPGCLGPCVCLARGGHADGARVVVRLIPAGEKSAPES